MRSATFVWFGLLMAAIFVTQLTIGQEKQARKEARKSHKVEIHDNEFRPANITIAVGDSITWVNVGPDNPHTATSDDIKTGDLKKNFHTGRIDVGQQAVTNFNTASPAGGFKYHCEFHSTMKGTITVQ